MMILTPLPVPAIAVLAGCALVAGAESPPIPIESPSGTFRFELGLADVAGLSGVPVYSMIYQGQTIIRESRLGLQAGHSLNLESGFSSVSADPVLETDSTWRPVYGERSLVRDHYRSRVYRLRRATEGSHRLSVEVRCYDEGVGFCYRVMPDDPGETYQILHEWTEFAFLDDHITWGARHAQDGYQKTTISAMNPGGTLRTYDRPQIFFAPGPSRYLAIGEARLVDFARLQLQASVERPHTVGVRLSSEVSGIGELRTPWRVIMAAGSPGQLLANNDLILNLNDPCAIEDTSWIKPGKVIREVTLSTEGALACVDFAASNGIDYIHFDAGWYGHEYDDRSDATTITVDPRRSKRTLDLHRVIRYAEGRNVGVMLYVNRRALERQLDVLLPLYRSWGVAGVKFGFVQVGSQEWTTWLHEAVRKAADHQLMVDVHDEYRPTGYSRTYPNLMTQEGIAGDETQPSAKKTLGILFSRGLAGAADNTICYYSSYVNERVNHAYQLAKTICMYSPLQFVFWYDRPQAATREVKEERPMDRIIGDEPELEFFSRVPTVWDDTRILAGVMEECAIVARRSGSEWYIGAMNAGEDRTFRIPLDFLEPDTPYVLRSYTHDPQAPTATRVTISDQPADAGTVLAIHLAGDDGAAYRILPRPAL